MPRELFNREIDYLRISVIDHCNLRCVYCMPLEGLRFLPSDELLTPAEIELVVRAAVSVGLSQVSPYRRRADTARRLDRNCRAAWRRYPDSATSRSPPTRC